MLDLTNTARFDAAWLGGIERIDLRSVPGGDITLSPSSILALTGMAATTSALLIEGSLDDFVRSNASLGSVAANGTVVRMDLDGNGTINNATETIGTVGVLGLISYDFGFGAGLDTYCVYTHTSYGILLVDSDINRSGIVL